jgi:hypothetical protein
MGLLCRQKPVATFCKCLRFTANNVLFKINPHPNTIAYWHSFTLL